MSKIIITDTTLRDGSHSVAHRFTINDVTRVVSALDSANVDIIEVGHGDGLAGSTANYGFSAVPEMDLIKAAVQSAKNSKIATLLLPGIGTVPDLEKVKDLGVKVIRVATHVTEADIAHEHIEVAKKMGFFVVGFLMMAHRAKTERVVEEAQKMESYGANVVYATDSAGALLPKGVKERISALKSALKIPVGFHSHNNLGLAIGNSLAAIEAGATYIDGSLGGLGAGAGNTPTEMLVGVMERAGIDKNANFFKTIDASSLVRNEVLEPYGVHLPAIQDSLMLGYAGVYSSFMLHAKRAAKRFNVDYRDIIVEAGRREAVGGQEDWLYEIAEELSKK
ncbi:MAG TPA: 4-hydroxy-2-oxovalerate aldolase [Clostridia bacterium]|jgi:4-hydroxy 2-oxovalerate aldolase|nr:4-hydroxy-2-oxovalerate aldolase [Clostridia bacterium]HQO56805.1 4-hydroxy-2-oxovalerate aldolase [Clostridia bacterium]HUM60570.1 4-hydroxy-2-oxovalerate aldolase [Clostridia bacterium]